MKNATTTVVSDFNQVKKAKTWLCCYLPKYDAERNLVLVGNRSQIAGKQLICCNILRQKYFHNEGLF